MKKRHLFLLIILQSLISTNVILAQKTHTISGYVSDVSTSEKLISATVYEKGEYVGTTTNLYGFYSLTLEKGIYNIICSFVGYQSFTVNLNLTKDTTINIKLESSITLSEVVISAENNVIMPHKVNRMSTINVSMDKVKSLPVLLGEQDLIKTIQLLPGVQSGSEGSSGLYVRGGGPDQNLILLDGVPIYNVSHLFGFFSVFNADAINNVELIKGGFPARYGGRLSSVLDIRMKEGNMNKFHGEGSVGLLSSKFSFEGPVIKDKTSFVVSARRTYIDVLTQPLIKLQESDMTAGYFFHDINAKINHKFSEKSRLYYSFYTGKDKFYMRYKDKWTESGTTYENIVKEHIRWGNFISALRWNYMFSPKLFSNSTITYSQYKFDAMMNNTEKASDNSGTTKENYRASYISQINDITAKIDFDYVPNPNHYIKFGAGDIYHTFNPEAIQFKYETDVDDNDTTFGSNKEYAHEVYAYFEDDIKISDGIKINPGIYMSGFILGDKFYYSVEPRFCGRILVGEKNSIKASYAYMTQYLHLLTNPAIGLPTDLWVPTTNKIEPEHSHQVALGYSRELTHNIALSTETYYKTMSNLIEYKDGASFFGNNENWEEKINVGKGWSYGAEILLEKKFGKTSGWIGYTLSWTERQFDDINFGEKFPYRYDRRHDIGIAITHDIKDNLDIGLVWVYGTGAAVSLGLEVFKPYRSVFPNNTDQTIEYIEHRNNYRMPSYHRLDLGINYHKKKKWGEATWSFGVYNIYNRKNPFFLYFSYDNGDKVLKQISIFPLIPSVSYNFKF